MPSDTIDALSPLDGRYAGKLAPVRAVFSEAGLMRERVRVECAWFLALAAGPAREALGALPAGARAWLTQTAADPQGVDVAAIKTIEARTNHDVKAVEYWIRRQLQQRRVPPAQLEWVHFGCTSEDINNLAYALMLKAARADILAAAAAPDRRGTRCHGRAPRRCRHAGTHARTDGYADDGRQGTGEFRRAPRAAAAARSRNARCAAS